MTANDSKSYLGCLYKPVDEWNNAYHCSIGKKPIHVFTAININNYGYLVKNFRAEKLWVWTFYKVFIKCFGRYRIL